VKVETGLFADGRVEVRGAGLRQGMTVGMPQ
jgi:multidrug efflux system membrane fusion protein